MSISIENLRQTLSGLVTHQAREANPEDTVAGVRPRVVVEPATEEEVAEVLAFADREGLKVLVRGGGTQLTFGLPPSGGDILLCTSRLDKVLEHEPQDQTISVQSGMRLADLQAHLAQTRQWLAIDPPLPAAATIGGIISTNISGARRLRFGAVRDQVIGIRVVLADGTIAKGGGKVVKNVAGYDLAKLFCGALGTLGVVVAASFRLYPLPSGRRTIILTSSSPALLSELALKVTTSTLVPTSVDLIGPGEDEHRCTLAIRFESGVPAAVEDQSAAVVELAGDLAGSAQVLADEEEASFWRSADNWTGTAPDEGSTLVLKASLLPTTVSRWLAGLDSAAAAAGVSSRWRAHIGHGTVYARISGTEEPLVGVVDAVRALAQAEQGSLVVQSAPAEIVRSLDVWGAVTAVDLMRRVKASFDPNNTLNPGRFVTDSPYC
jgi:glycolate oxidase FAD binding subunit